MRRTQGRGFQQPVTSRGNYPIWRKERSERPATASLVLGLLVRASRGASWD